MDEGIKIVKPCKWLNKTFNTFLLIIVTSLGKRGHSNIINN